MRAVQRQGATSSHSVRGVNYSTSPLLASKTPPWRSRFLVLLVGLGFLALAGRALYVQVLASDFFQKKGEERFASTVQLPASRGRILDRNGQILAISVNAPTVSANPQQFKANNEQKRALVSLLRLPLKELNAKLADDGAYVVLKRQIDDGVAQQIRALRIKGLHVEPGYIRRYPENEAAAHVVGFTDIEDKGQEGIELTFQRQLQGTTGSRGVVKDRLGRVVEELGEPVVPRDGRDVQLTIDSKVQALAYQRIRDAVQQHKAKAGSVVVLDAQSGEILALANYPSYLPGERRNLTGAQLRNRAITDVFEPGSTVKPFIAAKALENGIVRPETVIDGHPFRVGPLLVNDGNHGADAFTVAQVVQKSSNVGTVKLAQRLDNKEMGEMLAALGFGTKPQIGFPGAATGKLRPWKTWKPVEKATMSYGYGLSASLLQIARAYTAIARDGELAPLTLIKGEEALPAVRVFEPETARTMRQLMRGTVSKEGTAPLAQPIGYSAGGKTGTAEKQEGNGYNSDKHRSWFTGISPIDNPRVVVAVMIDEPTGVYFGGLVAAPVFKVVVEQALRTLNVPPDLEVKAPPVTAQNGKPARGKPLTVARADDQAAAQATH
ncbi:MAG TPA: penicillin-binding protein 2 [Ideonella sp.]|uniref:peptidoglycan D,D-transpeptidase FtsI family protein n=1 Tax=Ideonella sp. TaxID=1929293 RepID=UPI002E35AAD6|nr:penicillin-binding protein 2 [Ideonella sp.]HEX5685759.1 penicillin-binding protein 2 [Ideonella sp.]